MLCALTSAESSPEVQLHARHAEIGAANPTLRPTVWPWMDLPVVTLEHSRAWLVAPAERDPLRTPDGRHVIPSGPLQDLQRVAAAGARFHKIAIAHEVDLRGPVRSLLPILTNGPRTCTDRVARQLVGPVPPHPRVAQTALAMDLVAGGIVWVGRVGSVMASAVGRVSAQLRDPIIFGVVGSSGFPRAGEAALWYPLTAWTW